MSWHPLAMGAKKYLLIDRYSGSFISHELQRIIHHTKAFRILNHRLFDLAVFVRPLALSSSRLLGVLQEGDRNHKHLSWSKAPKDGYFICCPKVCLQHKDYMALRSIRMDLWAVHFNHISDHRQMTRNLHTCANEARATFHKSEDIKNLECSRPRRNDSSSASKPFKLLNAECVTCPIQTLLEGTHILFMQISHIAPYFQFVTCFGVKKQKKFYVPG